MTKTFCVFLLILPLMMIYISTLYSSKEKRYNSVLNLFINFITLISGLLPDKKVQNLLNEGNIQFKSKVIQFLWLIIGIVVLLINIVAIFGGRIESIGIIMLESELMIFLVMIVTTVYLKEKVKVD